MNIDKIKDGDRISLKNYRELLSKDKAQNKNSGKKRIFVNAPKGKDRISTNELKEALDAEKKGSKYNSIATYIDDIRFDSRWEAKRYSLLKIREKAKEITNLKLQVPYCIVINDITVTKYVADFVYYDHIKKQEVVEDAKGFLTPEYKIKRALMKAVMNIDIYETREIKTSFKRKKKKP